MDWFVEHVAHPALILMPGELPNLRNALEGHTNAPGTGRCRHCHVVSCRVWQAAYDRLALAGHLMIEPDLWAGPALRPSGEAA
jgi:hypothetical protein